MSGWIDLCRTGTWTAKDGRLVTITRGDLDAIVGGYNPAEREAPLVFGHPGDDEPAYGWVESLRRSGDLLQGRFTQVAEGVKELVSRGRYKKVSIALFPDGKTLRHIGLLGAAQPAVPGLRSVKFEAAAGEVRVIEFSEEELTAPGSARGNEENAMTVEELQQKLDEEKALREASEADAAKAKADASRTAAELSAYRSKQAGREIDGRIDKLIESSRVLPTDKALVKSLALSLGSVGGEIELSDGSGKKAPLEHFFDLLGSMPDRKLTTELSAPNGGKDEDDKLVDLTKYV